MDGFGTRVRVARGERAKAALARALGVDTKTVYRWEHGTSVPEAQMIAPLADALGVSVRWLLTGEDEAAA